MILRRLFVSFLPVLALALAVQARPVAAQQDAGAFVQDLAGRAIAVLKGGSGQSDRDREAAFAEIFRKGFDVEAIGRYVLGTYWRSATPEQRSEYLRLFESFVVKTYASRLNEYSGETLQVGRVTKQNDTQMVESQIVRPGRPPVRIVWQVENRPAGLKITDVLIENVSMTITQRSDFNSYISANGGRVDALIAELKRKTGG